MFCRPQAYRTFDTVRNSAIVTRYSASSHVTPPVCRPPATKKHGRNMLPTVAFLCIRRTTWPARHCRYTLATGLRGGAEQTLAVITMHDRYMYGKYVFIYLFIRKLYILFLL